MVHLFDPKHLLRFLVADGVILQCDHQLFSNLHKNSKTTWNTLPRSPTFPRHQENYTALKKKLKILGYSETYKDIYTEKKILYLLPRILIVALEEIAPCNLYKF